MNNKFNSNFVMKTVSAAFYFCLLAQLQQNVCGSPFLDSDTPIQTEIIDPTNRTIWAMFNLTDAQINRVKEQINANNKEGDVPHDVSFDNVKNYRINNIRHRLESALKVGSSEESEEFPLHEMAAYPVCNSESNEASWLHDNNVTIRFSTSFFELKTDNLNLDSAILRLYKYNPNATEDPNQSNSAEENNFEQNGKPKRCADPLLDSQIRITVSTVQQLRRNKRERKKRICNTIMMNVSKTGWVEIDIKRAIYIWENVERQQQAQQTRHQPTLVGWLMIEVHDDEDRPLKPGKFFQAPKCDQADFAIPWNYYGPHTALSALAAKEVPRYPRLDVKMIGYASFAPKAHNKQLHERLRENLRRQVSGSIELDNETTLSSESTASSSASSSVESSAASSILPTTNLLLSSSTAEEIRAHVEEQQLQQQHNHHKRHSSSLQFHNGELTQQQAYQHQKHQQQQQTFEHDLKSTEDDTEFEHKHHHRRAHNGHHHRHHRNHHHHKKQHQHQHEHQQHHQLEHQYEYQHRQQSLQEDN